MLTFGDGFTGNGRSKGLAPIDQPNPEPRGSLTFKLGIKGSDDGHNVSIDSVGVVQGQLPFDRTLFLRFPKATVTVDGRTYSLATKSGSLQENLGGDWTLTVIAGLNKPAKAAGAGEAPDEPPPAGVLIAKLDVSGLTATELLKGGAGDVEGRIASLKIAGSRLTPEVSGDLAVTVKK